MAEPLKSGWEYAGGNNTMVKNTSTGQVLDIYHPEYQNAAAPPPAGSPTGTAPQAPQGPQSAQQVLTQTPQAGAPPTVAGAFQQSLLTKLSQPVASMDSPELQPALAANRLAEQRGMERNRAMLAERAAATGTNMSGGFETGLMGLAQDRAAREGQFAGQAVADLGRRQSAEIMQALGLTGGMLGQQDQLALQDKLAQLDANLRQQGINSQTSLGQGDLALREKLGMGNLNLGLLGMLQGGQQFQQNLGAQMGIAGANLNQNALLGLLGGL